MKNEEFTQIVCQWKTKRQASFKIIFEELASFESTLCKRFHTFLANSTGELAKFYYEFDLKKNRTITPSLLESKTSDKKGKKKVFISL